MAQAKKDSVGSISLTTSNWLTEQQAIDALIKTLVDETDIANTVKITDAGGLLYGTLTNVGADNGLKYETADYTYMDAQHDTPMYESGLNAALKDKLWNSTTHAPRRNSDDTAYVAEDYYTAETWAAYIAAYNTTVNRSLNAKQQAQVDALTQAIYDARIALAYKKLNTSSGFAAAGTAIANAEAKKNETFYLEKYVNDYDLFASRSVVENGTLTKTYSTGETSTTSDLSSMADRLMTVYSAAQDMIDATAVLNNLFTVGSATQLSPRMTNEVTNGVKAFGAGFTDLLNNFVSGTYNAANNTFTSDKIPQDMVYQLLPYLANINTLLSGDTLINATSSFGGQSMKAYEALNYYTKALYDFCTTTRAVNATFATDLKATLESYYNTTITVDAGDLLSGSGILGGTPANVKLFNQTETAEKLAAIDSYFATAANWPYLFQLNGMTYYRYGENGTQASPTSTKEKCVEGIAPQYENSTVYHFSSAKRSEINSYISTNHLNATGAEDVNIEKLIGLLNLVGTQSEAYQVSTNNYGASDLYAWLMNYAEYQGTERINGTNVTVTYLLGSTTDATLATVGGVRNSYAPNTTNNSWYVTGCGKNGNTKFTNATERSKYYYYQLSTNTPNGVGKVYASTHGSWFTDASYDNYQSKKTAMGAIYSTNHLADLNSGTYSAKAMAGENTASAAYYNAITTNGWTSAAQAQLVSAVNGEQVTLCTAIANYYTAIKGMQKLLLIAMAEGNIVSFVPNGEDTSSYTSIGGNSITASLRLFVTGRVVANKNYTSNTYMRVNQGQEVGGRAYQNAIETLNSDKTMMVLISGGEYNGCYFSPYLPDNYTSGKIDEVRTYFQQQTNTTAKLRTIDLATSDVFNVNYANNMYTSVTGTLGAELKRQLDNIYLKGANTEALTKLILMFMCNSKAAGKPTSSIYNNANGGNKIGLGALDWIKSQSAYNTNLLTNGMYKDDNYAIIFNETTGLGATGAAYSYRTSPLMKLTTAGGYMSHTNAAATGLSGTANPVVGTTKISNVLITGLTTDTGFYFYNNYDPETLKSVIQFMIDKELIKPSAVPNPDTFTYNWDVSYMTPGNANDKRASFFLATGFFEQLKVEAMCQNLIKLYNGEDIYDAEADKTYYGLKLKAANAETVTKLEARQAVADEINKNWQVYNLDSTDWKNFETIRKEAEDLLGYEYLNFMFDTNSRTVTNLSGKRAVRREEQRGEQL